MRVYRNTRILWLKESIDQFVRLCIVNMFWYHITDDCATTGNTDVLSVLFITKMYSVIVIYYISTFGASNSYSNRKNYCVILIVIYYFLL